MIIGDIETTEKVEYEDLLKNYYEKMEIIEEQDKEIERLNNDIKELLKENGNKEKVIKAQDNIINELEKYLIEQVEKSYSNDYDNVLDKLDELKGSDKE